MGGLVAQLQRLVRRLESGDRLVGEQPQRLEACAGGQQPIARVIHPDQAERAALRLGQRHEQPVARPRVRAAAVQLRAEVDRVAPEALLGHLGRNEVTAGHLELVREQRRKRLERDAVVHGIRLHVPAGGGVRGERSPARGRQLDHDLVEPERVADAVADGLEDLVRVLRLGQPRGDLEDALEHALVLDVVCGALCDPKRKRRVVRDRHECVELLVRGAAPGFGLVDRDHADQNALRVAQWHEQRVLGPPGIRILALLDTGHVAVHAEAFPVEFASRDEVRAAALEALVEQRHPGRTRRAPAHELRDRILRPDGGGGEHVVEGRAVHVHHHGAIAEQLGDRAADVLEHVREVVLVADVRGALEHVAQARDRGELTGGHQSFLHEFLLATVPLSAAAGINATLSGTRGLHGVVTLILYRRQFAGTKARIWRTPAANQRKVRGLLR